MALLDWIIMLGTLLTIVLYGVIKTRNIKSMKSYLMGEKDLPWYTIGLSVMATQASAITFLSAPGQAYEEGMGFAQFYFGMPIAMVLLCIFVLPIYYRLNVYTAYEYLEGRFDLKTRTLTAVLFLMQRGFAAGLTIFAPAIILTNILNWDLRLTIIFIGALVIIYTVAGGTKAVSVTQKQQMIIILSGMFIAAVILVMQFPVDVSLEDAIAVAGKMEKLEVVNLEFDWNNKYNLWSGLIGGVFLFLSYFGTDQSQVQRYLSGKSLTQSRMGLLFNGIIKVPMQFLILFVGILVFIFFQFEKPPIHFNSVNIDKVKESSLTANTYDSLNTEYSLLFDNRKEEIYSFINARNNEDEVKMNASVQSLKELTQKDKKIRDEFRVLVNKVDETAETKDGDYVFVTFVTEYFPVGLVGLLLAVIFSAAMSSTSSELNALATTTVIDIYKRSLNKNQPDKHYLTAAKLFTIMWGVIAIIFAMVASLFDNLIEAVNIIGSLFYGTILGVFVVAFFFKKIKGNAVFIAAIISELIILYIYFNEEIAYLWLNLIGCILVMIIANLISVILPKDKNTISSNS